MDKLDTMLALLEEALEDKDWSKVEEVHSILLSHFDDPFDEYNLDDIENSGGFFGDDD